METGWGSKMDDAHENCRQSRGETLLRSRIAELERANERLRERLAALERERTEALSGSERMFQAILDAITETLVVLDSHGVVQAVNQTAADRLRCAKDDLVGCDGRNPTSRLMPTDVREARLACLDEVVRTGQPIRATDTRSGSVFDQTYYPVTDRNGRVTHVVVFAQDVTARVEMEKELVESRQKYQDLLDNVNDIIYTADRDGNLLTVNHAVKRVMGFDPQEVVGSHYSRWVPQATLGLLDEARARALEGQRTTMELTIARRDGSECPVELSLGPLDREHRIVGTQGVIRDIADRQRAEQTVRENEAMLRALFDAVTESVMLLDCEGTILTLSELSYFS